MLFPWWSLKGLFDSMLALMSGAKFVKAAIRPGVLPGILRALMSARNTTRAVLKSLDASDITTRAVLDSRQKALKLVANALYGFTGQCHSSPGSVPMRFSNASSLRFASS